MEADKVGRSSNIPLSGALGAEDAGTQRRLAAGRGVTTPTYAVAGLGEVPTEVIATPEDVARELSDMFFADIKSAVPDGQRGFGMAAKTKIRNLSMLPAPAPIGEKLPEIPLNMARLGSSSNVRSGFLALKQVSEKLGKPIKDAAVRKLVMEDLPKLMDGMPSSVQLRGRIAAKRMADEGGDVDDIMTAFEKSFGIEELRAAKARMETKAAEIKLRNQASGVSVLGNADVVETSPGTK
jgi:hypothetical protein